MNHFTMTELAAGLDHVKAAPSDKGVLEMIVRRPAVGAREVLETGVLHLEQGLVGDTWSVRGSSRTADGSRHPDMQVNIMAARAVALVAGSRDRWALAGDQLFIDIDVSADNMPPGTRLALGSAVVEITDQPHIGCGKFVARYGVDAMKLVNSAVGRALQLRGVNARVVQPGTIRVGDLVRKLAYSSVTPDLKVGPTEAIEA